MICEHKEQIKYLDAEGLLFLMQVLEQAIGKQIQTEAKNIIMSDKDIKERIDDVISSHDIVSQSDFDKALANVERDVRAQVADAKTAMRAELKPLIDQEIAAAKAQMLNDVQEMVAAEVARQLGQTITPAAVDAKIASALTGYVKKSGDTMTGSLDVAANVKGVQLVTGNDIIFY